MKYHREVHISEKSVSVSVLLGIMLSFSTDLSEPLVGIVHEQSNTFASLVF